MLKNEVHKGREICFLKKVDKRKQQRDSEKGEVDNADISSRFNADMGLNVDNIQEKNLSMKERCSFLIREMQISVVGLTLIWD